MRPCKRPSKPGTAGLTALRKTSRTAACARGRWWNFRRRKQARPCGLKRGIWKFFWHDEHLAVCNKPAGLTVHPCPSCPEHTLVQRLLARFPQLAKLEGLRPGIVHRLDKDTSGLLAVALTEADRLALSAAFAGRVVHKGIPGSGVGPPCGRGRMPQTARPSPHGKSQTRGAA